MSSMTDLSVTLSILALTILACSTPRSPRPTYPEAPRADQTDDYFGTTVADPYRWLEDLESETAKSFVAAQNALAQPYLEAIPLRAGIAERMRELWRYERHGLPQKRGGRYFYEYNNGGMGQDVLAVADSPDGEQRVLIDPNTLRDDATISLAAFAASPDGAYVAYGVSDGGTDFKIWRVRDVATGEDLADELRHMKFSDVSWTPDSAGFYYSRYPALADGGSDDSRQVSVFHHRLGTAQAEDRHVYSVEDDGPDPYAEVTDDGRFLILNIFEGYSANAVHVQELSAPDAPVVRLLDAWDALYTFRGNRGNELFFETTHEAPNGRVVAIDPARPEPESWRVVVPEGADVLTSAEIAGGRVIAQYLVDARSRVRLFDLDGGEAGEVELPGIGTAGGFGGKIDDPETFFSFETFTAPRAVFRLDLSTGVAAAFRGAPPPSAAAFVTEQVFYTSKDGTRVPMFLIHRPGIERNGDNPTLLYGYGGFNVAESPEYKVRWTMWLEMGGLLAVANLRGGSEYGEAWHEAGTRTNKQNVFDDFIAAAEWLIAEGYTRTPRLAIHGRSNGGLLVGAVMTQRPELFGVALPAVGVLDMLRYHTASANAYQWGSDYGWSENEQDFRALRAYSPVHNVDPGTCFPPTLVTTANLDDRVVPWHSYKFAAALQHAQGCDNPVLLRIETRAGHGGNKPTWMRIEDYADQWAFAAKHLGMELPD